MAKRSKTAKYEPQMKALVKALKEEGRHMEANDLLIFINSAMSITRGHEKLVAENLLLRAKVELMG